jgi:hypothetical protein
MLIINSVVLNKIGVSLLTSLPSEKNSYTVTFKISWSHDITLPLPRCPVPPALPSIFPICIIQSVNSSSFGSLRLWQETALCSCIPVTHPRDFRFCAWDALPRPQLNLPTIKFSRPPLLFRSWWFYQGSFEGEASVSYPMVDTDCHESIETSVSMSLRP